MAEKSGSTLTGQTVVVILAAGKGTRMGSIDTAKVCFEIDGIPAINRIIATFKKRGFDKFLVVTGFQAEQVMETVSSEHSDVIFVYQSPQLGTGHAAKVAADTLQTVGHTGLILLTMGDKFIEEYAIELVADEFIRKQADFALLTIPKTKKSQGSGGRVFINSKGEAIAIIERMDIARQGVADEIRFALEGKSKISAKKVSAILNSRITDGKKRSVAIPELVKLAEGTGETSKKKVDKILALDKYNLSIDGRRYTAKEIEKRCKSVNPSLYLSSCEAFYQGVGFLDNNNAQKEYYLTDIVRHLASCTDSAGKRKYKVVPVAAGKDSVVQGFNSPDELLAIQDYVRKRKIKVGKELLPKSRLPRNQCCKVKQWIKKIETNGPALRRWLGKVYGNDENLSRQKCKDLLCVLKYYGKRFGFDNEVVVVRAPGRVNLMGRHVDHRGGCNNFLAIHRETLSVAGLRNDNDVVAVNTQPKQFKPQHFNISDLIGRFAWSDWINFVNSDWVRNMLRSSEGNWGNYIKSAMLRLQHKYQDLAVQGLNIALSGDVPIAAGLSSSSTIVVATLQAAIALNRLELEAQQFIDLCGEGEWFVGSRGGAGDHAAIYLGQRGKIANVGYLPFSVNKIIDAPAEYQVVIANSHVKAAKSSAARHIFNSKICSYNLGLELLKLRCPEIGNRIECLRDVNTERLACSVSDIYRILLKVPQYMKADDFKELLPNKYSEVIESNFATHDEQEYYNVRGVLLFGIAEIIRSKICVPWLEEGHVKEFGQLMKISHDGDRVSRQGIDKSYHSAKDPYDDIYLDKLVADLASEDPERVLNAQLYMQPGFYGCSTEDIDRMVDIACNVPGVAGAQIAGAGLGGCIMILCRKDSVGILRKALAAQYYKVKKLKPAVIGCTTVEGAGLAEF